MPRPLGIGLVALLFLLIPGVVGVKAFLRYYVSLDDLSRIDKLAATVGVGGASLAVLLVALNAGCWFDVVASFVTDPHVPNYASWGDAKAWCDGSALTMKTLSKMPVVVIVGFVTLQTGGVGTLGGVAGRWLNRREEGPPREPKRIEQPWEYASKKTARETDHATVITTGGEEIRGEIHRMGSPSEDYDILLKDSEKVIRHGSEEVDTDELTAFTYHHYRDIAQIRFQDLDDETPDSDFDMEDAEAAFDEEFDEEFDEA